MTTYQPTDTEKQAALAALYDAIRTLVRTYRMDAFNENGDLKTELLATLADLAQKAGLSLRESAEIARDYEHELDRQDMDDEQITDEFHEATKDNPTVAN